MKMKKRILKKGVLGTQMITLFRNKNINFNLCSFHSALFNILFKWATARDKQIHNEPQVSKSVLEISRNLKIPYFTSG